jgi:hypothetical protein
MVFQFEVGRCVIGLPMTTPADLMTAVAQLSAGHMTLWELAAKASSHPWGPDLFRTAMRCMSYA